MSEESNEPEIEVPETDDSQDQEFEDIFDSINLDDPTTFGDKPSEEKEDKSKKTTPKAKESKEVKDKEGDSKVKENEEVEENEDDSDEEEDDSDNDVEDENSEEEKALEKRASEVKKERMESNQTPQFFNVEDAIQRIPEQDRAGVSELLKEFPELEVLLNAMIPAKKAQENVKQEASAQKSELTPEQQKQKLEDARYWTELLSKKPNAEEINRSQDFRNWLGKQSDSIKELAALGTADDAVMIINAFEAAKSMSDKQKAEKKMPEDKKKKLHSSTLSSNKANKKSSRTEEEEFEEGWSLPIK